MLEGYPEGLSWVTNLGMMNVFAATSGKENVARHVMEHFGGTPNMSFLLCDDENDLGACLGLLCCLLKRFPFSWPVLHRFGLIYIGLPSFRSRLQGHLITTVQDQG